jgi:hypothetical protein
MKKYHYAVQWVYGKDVWDEVKPLWRVFRFDSVASREKWVENGTPYISNAGFRESKKSKELISFINKAKKFWGGHNSWAPNPTGDFEMLES